MKIVFIGATGLIGGLLLNQLLADASVARVTSIGRRAPAVSHPRLTALTGPVADWPALAKEAGADVAISTLGTTLKQAGSKAAFAALDRDTVVAFAVAARRGGVRQCLLVSSVGADPAASGFYLRTKGEAEEAVRALGFDRVDVFRPGLLRGDRTGPSRMGEGIALALTPLIDRLIPARHDRYRSIAATQVATAMTATVGAEAPGRFIHYNRDMA